LARVLLRDAPIVLLDEATANLDEVTEARVVRTLEGFLAGRTAVIVSHRPALLRLADQIVTLGPPDLPTGTLSDLAPVGRRLLL
jgi:ABC-type bacteriocin/lantibiotic exporter with double-glycine peptidase domain